MQLPIEKTKDFVYKSSNTQFVFEEFAKSEQEKSERIFTKSDNKDRRMLILENTK